MPIPRTNINAAAALVAAHFGLSIRLRETLGPSSGRLTVIWTLDAEGKAHSHTLELCCTPPPFKPGGWYGGVTLVESSTGLAVKSRTLVDPSEGIASKMTSKMARERFCLWAGELAAELRTTGVAA